ncbi:hypothetical protein FRB99_003944 [Tulasnella sp. 403]|nr:hypothetical protein FRB99_003944 [Tulasnella sp. 403]
MTDYKFAEDTLSQLRQLFAKDGNSKDVNCERNALMTKKDTTKDCEKIGDFAFLCELERAYAGPCDLTNNQIYMNCSKFIIVQIFHHLPANDLINCANVCRKWELYALDMYFSARPVLFESLLKVLDIRMASDIASSVTTRSGRLLRYQYERFKSQYAVKVLELQVLKGLTPSAIANIQKTTIFPVQRYYGYRLFAL